MNHTMHIIKEAMKNSSMHKCNHSMHNQMKHGAAGSNHSGMTMYFNLANPFYLFLKELFITSNGAICGGAIVLFVLTILYEGLKTYREILLYRKIRKNRKYLMNESVTPSTLLNDNHHDITPSGDAEIITPNSSTTFKSRKKYIYPVYLERPFSRNRFALTRFTKDHVIQSILHLLQTFISYLLMLAFMTFNVWICLAILLGSMIGYFIFGWRKSLILENLDHCH
uniref:Copper transport protein n=1 Tax=Schmidtea mediterranea TaxID=79327 RepID=A0A0H3YFI8_SCHMD|nr:slc31a-2 [Schmidtea mediterranea]